MLLRQFCNFLYVKRLYYACSCQLIKMELEGA